MNAFLVAATGVLAAVAVLCVAAARRSRPGYWPAGAARPRVRGGLAGAVGSAVRRAAGRPSDRAADRRVGSTLMAALALLPITRAGAVAAAAWCWGAPPLRHRRALRRAATEVANEVPEVVDLLVLAVGAGHNVRLAVEVVAARAPPRFAAAFAGALDATARRQRLADALDDMARSLGEPARPLVAAITAADRYGAPLSPALERLAVDARLERRRRAEAAARRVPVLLLFPLVLCVLPAFALLTVVPLLLGTLRSLRP
jgi:tight adherence protein C